jgi:ABC-type transport system involved in multi-copper enzyme maturation permease subunit
VSLDLEFLIRIVLGLLAISLAAGSLALERETGVLLVLRSQPVSPTALLLAKLVGGSIALGVALAVVLSGAAASLGVFAPELWSPDLKATLLALGWAGLIYLATLYALGLVVGSLARSASAANVAAMVTWIVVAAASVPTIEFIDQAIAPVPAPEITETHRLRDYETQRRHAEIVVGTVFRDTVGPHWESSATPEQLDHLNQAWRREALSIRQHLQTIDDDAVDAVSRQRRLWHRLVRSTPGTLFFETASRIARNGLPTAERWDTAADDQQVLLDHELFDDPPQVTVRVPVRSVLTLVQITFKAAPDSSTLSLSSGPRVTARTGLADAAGPIVISGLYMAGCIVLALVAFLRTCN